MPVLARAVREVETGVQRGHALSTLRPRFQAIALLVREERARVKTDPAITEARRAEQLKRLDGVATILAKTAASETSLLSLLADDAVISDAARALKREMREAAGEEPPPDEDPTPEPEDAGLQPDRRVVPRAVISRQLASPFMVPDFSAVEQRPSRPPPARDVGAPRPAAAGLRGPAAPRPAWTCPTRPPCAHRATSS